MIKTSKVDRYNPYRLYDSEKYSLSNMLLKDAKFPTDVDQDKVGSVWDDRVYSEWREAMEEIKSTESGDGWWAGVSNRDLLAFTRRLIKKIDPDWKHKITGARIVRYTNMSSGYPTLRLDYASGGTIKKEPTDRVRTMHMTRDGYMAFGFDNEY